MVSNPVAKPEIIDRTGYTGLDHRWPGLLPLPVFSRPSSPAIRSRLNADALLSFEATKADIESHFASHGTGEITEIKLMNGFGFIEYKDAMDARDVVPGTLLS